MKIRSWILKGSAVLGLIFTIVACNSDDFLSAEEQFEKDMELIDNYLAEEGIQAVELPSGLRYVIHEEGNGSTPTLADDIRVKYSGTLLGESKVFDSSNDVTFPLSNLIVGWQIGFQELQEGDIATFYIPSILGYGARGSGSIPPNSVLVFDVELIEVK